MLNKIMTVAVVATMAAGFATTSFAQTGMPAPAVEKKVEAPKAAVPAKVEVKKEAAKATPATPATKHENKTEKTEVKTPAAK